MVTKDIRFKQQKSEVPGPGNYEVRIPAISLLNTYTTHVWSSPRSFNSNKFSQKNIAVDISISGGSFGNSSSSSLKDNVSDYRSELHYSLDLLVISRENTLSFFSYVETSDHLISIPNGSLNFTYHIRNSLKSILIPKYIAINDAFVFVSAEPTVCPLGAQRNI